VNGRLKQDFSTVTLVLIPVAIAMNIAVGQIIYTLKVPLYLDTIGTVLVGVLAGPWAGALTGLLSNLV
jgi:energy-coupling factor transport system substrate-specific component